MLGNTNSNSSDALVSNDASDVDLNYPVVVMVKNEVLVLSLFYILNDLITHVNQHVKISALITL